MLGVGANKFASSDEEFEETSRKILEANKKIDEEKKPRKRKRKRKIEG